MTADPLNLAALTEKERDAVMTPWWKVAQAEEWDADADTLYWSAVDALAWTLVDGSMDTADREPSAECVQQARATAERMLLAGARLDLAERATAAEADAAGWRTTAREYESQVEDLARIIAATRIRELANEADRIAHIAQTQWDDLDPADCDLWRDNTLAKVHRAEATVGEWLRERAAGQATDPWSVEVDDSECPFVSDCQFAPTTCLACRRWIRARAALDPAPASEVREQPRPENVVKAEVLREMEFEIRDARTLDPATKAAICAVMRGRANRYEAASEVRDDEGGGR